VLQRLPGLTALIERKSFFAALANRAASPQSRPCRCESCV